MQQFSSNPCLDNRLSSILYKSPPWQLQSQLSPWKYLLLWKRMCSNCKQQWQWQQGVNAKPKNHIEIPPNICHLLHSLSCPTLSWWSALQMELMGEWACPTRSKQSWIGSLWEPCVTNVAVVPESISLSPFSLSTWWNICHWKTPKKLHGFFFQCHYDRRRAEEKQALMLQEKSVHGSHANEENAELLALGSIGVDHVEREVISWETPPLIPCPHVHNLFIWRWVTYTTTTFAALFSSSGNSRDDTSTHGYWLHQP